MKAVSASLKIGAAILLGTNILPLTSHAIPVGGSSSGVFENPAGAVWTGAGTSHFEWGNATPGNYESLLEFSGETVAPTETGIEFSVGKLEYINTSIDEGTGATTVSLRLTLDFDTAGLAGVSQDFVFQLNLINNPNVEDPPGQFTAGSADFVQIANAVSQEVLTVPGEGDFQLQLRFGAVAVGQDVPGGFSPSDNEFHVFEFDGSSAELLGLFVPVSGGSSGGSTAGGGGGVTVPDGGATAGLLGFGILMLGCARRFARR
jgi:hypothetical protein